MIEKIKNEKQLLYAQIIKAINKRNKQMYSTNNRKYKHTIVELREHITRLKKEYFKL